MSVYYEKFTRHARGEGIKGATTHYCPGCGHGLAHNYLAETIEALDIQDRTVLISPVGCSVFMYYYMDVGNTQAAHGRAPAVAIGHKVANPDAVVICYQGDGDLASIGLAEIIQTAQLGLPITVIFVNNGTYAMTGGQLAPTTPMGMATATSPDGRDRLMGEPLKVAEMIAQMDGPIYVERVALFDNKQRNRAKKAIRKAIRLQTEKRGFAFVEVLSECPTHLRMSSDEAQEWIKEKMLPIFPLGVKKDLVVEPWFDMDLPNFDPQALVDQLGTAEEELPRFSDHFPAHIDTDDISVKMAGAGGDGAQTAAMLLTRAAINESFDATHIPSYGPQSRGGTSYADVHIARTEVLSPAAPDPHILIAFNSPSLMKFAPAVRPGGIVIYDSSVITEVPELDSNVQCFGVPMTEIARSLGNIMVKNIVALGALQSVTELFPPGTFLTAIRSALSEKCALIPLNEAAFEKGRQFLEALTH